MGTMTRIDGRWPLPWRAILAIAGAGRSRVDVATRLERAGLDRREQWHAQRGLRALLRQFETNPVQRTCRPGRRTSCVDGPGTHTGRGRKPDFDLPRRPKGPYYKIALVPKSGKGTAPCFFKGATP